MAKEVFVNRIGWARTYLKKAGLLETPRRGFYKITKRGKEILKTNPSKITNSLLLQFDDFKEFKTRRKKQEVNSKEVEEMTKTPEETFEIAHLCIL